MNSKFKVFLFGFRKTLPFQSGVLPFGIMFSTLATAMDQPWWLVILISVIVFAGSSQLVFIDLVQQLGSPLQAVLGSNIVNARHLIYSAGVSQEFSYFPRRWKMILGYLLTDQLYAISQMPSPQRDQLPVEYRPWFYFGSGSCTWFFWVLSTAFGILFGQYIPESWNLSFSIPLMFLPLVFSVSKNRFAYVSCVLAVGFVFVFKNLPFGLGVFVSILLASLIGFFIEKKMKRKS